MAFEPAVGSFAAAPFDVVEWVVAPLCDARCARGFFYLCHATSTMCSSGQSCCPMLGIGKQRLCSIAARNTSVKPSQPSARESRHAAVIGSSSCCIATLNSPSCIKLQVRLSLETHALLFPRVAAKTFSSLSIELSPCQVAALELPWAELYLHTILYPHETSSPAAFEASRWLAQDSELLKWWMRIYASQNAS